MLPTSNNYDIILMTIYSITCFQFLIQNLNLCKHIDLFRWIHLKKLNIIYLLVKQLSSSMYLRPLQGT